MVDPLEDGGLDRASFVDREVPELGPELGDDVADDPALAGSARCRASLLGDLVGCTCRRWVCRHAHCLLDVDGRRAPGSVGCACEDSLGFFFTVLNSRTPLPEEWFPALPICPAFGLPPP